MSTTVWPSHWCGGVVQDAGLLREAVESGLHPGQAGNEPGPAVDLW